MLILLIMAGVLAARAADPVHDQGRIGTFIPVPDADANLITFSNGFTIDTRFGEPNLPERYRLAGPTDGSVYRIVQFTGPIYQDWLKALTRIGVQPFGYLPRYAVIAKMDAASCARVADLPMVNWVGLFQPAYKLEAALLDLTGTHRIVIQVTLNEDYRRITEYLAAQGATLDDITINDFGTTITATFDARLLPALAQMPEVFWMQAWSEITTCNANGQWVMQTGWRNTAPSNTDTIARRVWNKGVRGQRLVLGVTDTGLNLYTTGHDMFRDPAYPNPSRPFVNANHRKVVAYKRYNGADVVEGQYHGSHVNGTVAGDDSINSGTSYYDGIAYKARLYFEDLTNGTSFVIPTNFWATWDTVHASRGLPDSLRCYQHSGSWGWSNSSGTYLIQDASTDAYCWAHKDFLNIMAAGNEYSTRTIRNPGIAKDVLTIGATQNGTLANAIASFSSRGPTLDNRYKPTVVAPGDLTYSSTASPGISTYSSMSGTSMATPTANGTIGLMRCYLKEGFYPTGAKRTADTFGYISSALLRSMAVASADPNVGTYTVPDNNIGFGRLNADSVLYFTGDTRKLMLFDDTVGLATGQYRDIQFQVNSAIPLKIALCWTDTAAAASANPTLVNNLHLLATGPSYYYRGNQTSGGQSTQNPTNWDNINTEEWIRVNSPATGLWTIRVSGQSVVSARQPFGLTITGDVSQPSLTHDVGCTRILAPAGTIDSGTVVTPACSVYNYGQNAESYTVRLKIGAAYNSTVTVTSHAVGTRVYVTFPSWTALPRGALAVTCSTELSGDLTPSNDKQTGSVQVQVLDAQTVSIIAPTGTVNQGAMVTPQAQVRNNGNTSQTFNVRFDIADGYNNTQSVTLAAGATQTVSFTNWTAATAGTWAVKCSTQLTGDRVTANDKATGSVFVQTLDAQTVSIIAPNGTVNQGAVITPQAQVRNNGNTSQTFNVRFDIADGYNNTQSVTLAAGATQTVSFTNWTAATAGTWAVKCSTQLAGDMSPANDKVTSSVFVQSLDVQTVAILTPTGTVNQGTVIAPTATVRNNGNSTQTFTVKYTITGGYADSVTITNLAAGATTTATFANWTANPLGTLTTACSTRLAGDMSPSNNKATSSVLVQTLDAQTVSIIAPTGTVSQGAVVTPQAQVRNNGNTSQTFNVRFDIADGYNNTQSVTLAAGATQTVSFTNWTAATAGTWAVKCSTQLTGDLTPANDKVTGSVFVQGLDAQAVSIIAPTGTVNQGAVVTPQAQVRNNGNTSQTFNVRFDIADGYNNTQSVTLAAGATQTVSFTNWTAATAGTWAVKCSTQLSGDMAPANDKVTGSVFVQAPTHDVGCTRILAPTGTTDSATVVTPACSVYNFGNTTESFVVRMRVGALYNGTATVTSLAPGVLAWVTFPGWTALPRGTLVVTCSTELAGDATPANDRQTGSVLINVHDVAPTVIIRPFGSILPDSIAPQVRVRNLGTVREACDVTFLINCTPPYACIVSLPGGLPYADTALDFPSWTAVVGAYTARCSTYLASDQVSTNNVISAPVTVGTPGVGWERKADPPIGGRSKNVKDGGALAYNPGPDTGYVYAFKGNGTCEFSRYNTTANAWLAKESIPAIGVSGKKKAVKKGGSMTWAADHVYGAKGNGTTEWWRYDPALSGTPTYPWIERIGIPFGARACREGCGAVTVMVGDTACVYFLKGSATQEFYRFNVATGIWTTQASAPVGASGRPYKNGSCLATDGTTIWALKGSYNELFAYNVATNTWTSRAGLPFTGSSGKKKKVKDGAGIAFLDGTLFALKGGNTREFWTYATDSDRWRQAEDMPVGGGKNVRGGGALVAASDRLFAFKGNNTLEFYSYTPSAVTNDEARVTGTQGSSTIRVPQSALRISPNPFSGTTSINYTLPQAGKATLRLYDVSGQLVATLAEGYHNAGSYSLAASGQRLAASGVYVLKLTTVNTTSTAKLIIE
jgi:hypothetical protein